MQVAACVQAYKFVSVYVKSLFLLCESDKFDFSYITYCS